MDTATLYALDRRHIWHPFTQAQTALDCQPIRSARGTILTAVDGREFIDLISSWWVTLHGHAHPLIAEAIYRQSQTLEQVVFAGFTHEPAVSLAQRLTSLLPEPLTRVFYSDNGSTAVEVAMKAALQFHHNLGRMQRRRFVAFEGGYHGDTVGAMSAGVSSKFFQAWHSMLFPVDILPVPTTWDGDTEIDAKEEQALSVIEGYLAQHGDAVSAAVIEPLIQGAGGMRIHRASFLQEIERRFKACGALLIFDEVMTGFGRTGDLFACLSANVEPDFVCLSKGLTGGFLPMAATVTTEAVYQAFLSEKVEAAFLHGHSFTANPLGCAAALASLDLLLDPVCVRRRHEIEAQHKTMTAALAATFPRIAHPRVQGTIAAFDVLAADGGYASSLGSHLGKIFYDNGILLRPLGNVIYLLPPYCVSDEQLMHGYEVIGKALSSLPPPADSAATTETPPSMNVLSTRIAAELSAREDQIDAAIALLDAGSTVPFIARYRKEATGGLDDGRLRALEERLRYLRELEERRQTVLKSIEEQGKLTDALRLQIFEADTKTRLEDVYLPYKPKRRTKAQQAREAGLEPLAEALFTNPGLVPETEARKFIAPNVGVTDADAALEGARHILVERFSEDADLVGKLRERLWNEGLLIAQAVEDKKTEGVKYADYFDHREAIARVPSHRALAMFRGRAEGVLRLSLTHPNDPEISSKSVGPCEQAVAAHYALKDQGRPADTWLAETVRWAWKGKLALHIEIDLMGRLRERAEEEAIHVFATNLRDLLLAAPAGMRPTLALDPGFRTGVKVAVMDATGKVVETATIYPHDPKRQWEQSLAVLGALILKHRVELVAIGNGTASRETDKLVQALIAEIPTDLKPIKVVVSEAGASVYSASASAAKEFPTIDVSLRGAISIGRRLQDPLAELVKIDPKSIGVGQYQHDVNQTRLARALDAVVEDCVNAVGVDLNTASAPLLARVSGVGERTAENIVAHRDQNGPFSTRASLLKVGGLGPKTFEQCAGFLRIRDGEEPLDASAVHPEAYPVVARILTATRETILSLLGNRETLRSLRPESFADDVFGTPTVADILKELEKPGRDPRPEFKTAVFKEGIEKIADLRPGMVLEGTVTNVAAFGAFVDIGVHQDGLIHVSQIGDHFVKDPRDALKAGDVVTVKVIEIDLPRQRISLTRRLHEPSETPSPVEKKTPTRAPASKSKKASAPLNPSKKRAPSPASPEIPFGGAMAEALLKAGFGKKQ